MLNRLLDYTYQSRTYCCGQAGYDSCTARGEAWGHPWHLTRLRAGPRAVAGVEAVLCESEQGCPVPTSAGLCSQCCCSEQPRRSEGDQGAAHLITVSIIRGSRSLLSGAPCWPTPFSTSLVGMAAMERCPTGRGGKGCCSQGLVTV